MRKILDGLDDMSVIVGKWFNDIDKLMSFKVKYKIEFFFREKKEIEREWILIFKKFYKCILNCR